MNASISSEHPPVRGNILYYLAEEFISPHNCIPGVSVDYSW